MSSTEPYPEVAVDESGIVPNQTTRGAEWPKKIRTLTAAELDRLTIDHNGRFYWDGKLVNYEPPEAKERAARADDHEPTTLDALERSVYEHNAPDHIEGAELDRPLVARERAELRDVDFDTAQETAASSAESGSAPVEGIALPGAAIHVPERVRVKLSRWQSFGVVILVFGMLVGATGMAAYGFVAMHDWACRIGLISSYCVQAPAERPPARIDIPA